ETELLQKATELKTKKKHQLSKQTASLLQDYSRDDVIAWLQEHLSSRIVNNGDLMEVKSLIDKLVEMDRERLLQNKGMFTIPKLHLLSYFSPTISLFGTLQQFFIEISETLHKRLKEAYRKSNKNNI